MPYDLPLPFVVDLYRGGKYPTEGSKDRVVALVTLAMLLLAKGSKMTDATQAVQMHSQCSELLSRADQYQRNFYLSKCGTGEPACHGC